MAAPGPLWLLLLPAAPSLNSMIEVKSAYGPALVETLQQVSQQSKSTSEFQTLDVVVALAEFPDDFPRRRQYPNLQEFIRQLYSLLCVIYAQHSIDIENGNDVTCRISLFKAPKNHGEIISMLDNDHVHSEALTFKLQACASCTRPWQRLLSVDNDFGTSLVHDFLLLRNKYGPDPRALKIDRVQPGPYKSSDQKQEDVSAVSSSDAARHFSVAVGGTFDHLHAGHQLLLTMTGLVLEPTSSSETGGRRTLTIGITGDELLKSKKFAEELQNWDERQQGVAEFVSAVLMLDSSAEELILSQKVNDAVSGARSVQNEYKSGLLINYVEIFDPFGPTITDENISALVVSAETRSGGKAVNDRRAERGWSPLEVFEVGVLNARDEELYDKNETTDQFTDKISSTAIRERIHLRRCESKVGSEMTK